MRGWVVFFCSVYFFAMGSLCGLASICDPSFFCYPKVGRFRATQQRHQQFFSRCAIWRLAHFPLFFSRENGTEKGRLTRRNREERALLRPSFLTSLFFLLSSLSPLLIFTVITIMVIVVVCYKENGDHSRVIVPSSPSCESAGAARTRKGSRVAAIGANDSHNSSGHRPSMRSGSTPQRRATSRRRWA